MVIAGNGHNLQFLVGGCGEITVFNAQLLYSRSIQLSQDAHHPCFFTSTRRTIDQQVREVSAMNLKVKGAKKSLTLYKEDNAQSTTNLIKMLII